MLIELSVDFYPDDYDPDDDDTLGKKTKPERGPLMINTNHVVAFSPIDKGKRTRLRLTNRERWDAEMPYNKFKLVMEEALTDEVYIPGEN